MGEIVLSIAMPIRGLTNEVKNNINSLMKIKSDEIEILIIDNDETISNSNDVGDLRDSRLRYIKNKRDIGRDQNIVKCIREARTDYILLLSGQDYVYENAVNEIIEEIKKKNDNSIIIGRVITDIGRNYAVYPESKTYKKGYDSLAIIPIMGNLIPFVVNRRYLDIDELSAYNDLYIQQRIAIRLGAIGNCYVIKEVIGEIKDDESNKVKLENKKIQQDINFCKSWNLTKDEPYCEPINRAKYLIMYLEYIETFKLRLNNFINIVDKYFDLFLRQTLEYAIYCREPYNDVGYGRILNSEEALNEFFVSMNKFFKRKEEEKKYCYTGRCRDKLNNEKILIVQAETIYDQIKKEKEVYIYNNGEMAKILSRQLKKIGLSSKVVNKDEINEGDIVLVDQVYDETINNDILSRRASPIFMDRIGRYFMVIYCDKLNKDVKFSPEITYWQ